jgi:hypothetical protein
LPRDDLQFVTDLPTRRRERKRQPAAIAVAQVTRHESLFDQKVEDARNSVTANGRAISQLRRGYRREAANDRQDQPALRRQSISLYFVRREIANVPSDQQRESVKYAVLKTPCGRCYIWSSCHSKTPKSHALRSIVRIAHPAQWQCRSGM